MSDPNPQPTPRPRRRFGIWMLLSLALLAGLAGIAALSLTGRMIGLPDWATARIEARLNAAAAPVSVKLGGVDVFFSASGVPQVHLRQVVVSDAEGRPVARVPEASAVLAPGPLMSGELALRHVALTGAELSLRRASDGSFDLALGDAVVPVQRAETLADVLDGIDRLFLNPVLAGLEGVSVEQLALSYEDARAGRVWNVENGLLTLEQTPDQVALWLFFSLRSDQGLPSEVALSFETVKGSPETRVSANFSDVAAADIATQSPALAFLSVIDAPISGAMRSGVTAEGALAPLSAALEIGAGALRPEAGAPPIRFNRGKSYFSYSPDEAKITLDEISLDTAALRMRAEGHAFLRDEVNGWPRTLISQVQFREVELDPEGVFEAPARFTGGALDLKLELDPFTATIGQVVLTDPEGSAYRGKGLVRARPDGWQVDLDLALDAISEARLLALWPVDLVPGTRSWIANNVLVGNLENVTAALRLAPDAAPRVALNHEFRDSKVRFLGTMPPVEQGSGYASILDNQFTLVVEEGKVTAPSGGQVDVAGSVMRVGDITQRPARAEIDLRTDSGVQAALSLLDLEPLEIMSKAGQPVDLAEGHAVTEAHISVPLVKGVQPGDVAYSVSGRLEDVRSDKLVKGRVLAAEALELHADLDEVSIGGEATLDGVPVRGTWVQKMGPGHQGTSRVEGMVELSQRAVEAFDIGLPDGSVSGAGWGEITVELARDAPPRFELISDLNRVGLRLADLGWSKPRNATGRLSVAGTFGAPPAVESLAFSAPGLTATGAVSITPEGALDAARFDRVQLGGWLDAPVVLTGRGKGRAPAVRLAGGTVDLRRRKTFGGSGGGSSGGGDSAPIEVALDRLIVSDGIRLAGVRGALSQTGGLNGTLTGQVVGGAPVRITLAPQARGTGIRVQSEDAGGVLRGAGIFEKSRGGTMDMVLTPLGQPGHYSGNLGIKNTRVRGAPVLAELLSAISVVGLLEQLGGDGLVFSDVSAGFTLTPEGVELKRGSAIGPSLGISLAGIYSFDTNRLKMQGVISPIYMLNVVGSVITRRGEGLFGFNYRLRGDAKEPKVSVNPLSILTPGMLREMFRGPAPRLKQ
jgi:hypothetical protein